MLTGCFDDTCMHIGGLTSGPLPDLLWQLYDREAVLVIVL